LQDRANPDGSVNFKGFTWTVMASFVPLGAYLWYYDAVYFAIVSFSLVVIALIIETNMKRLVRKHNATTRKV